MAFAQTFAAAAAIWSEVASCEPLSWNSVGWDVFSSKKKTGWMMKASATLTRWLYGIWGLSGQSIKSLAQTELNTTEAHVAPQGPWAAGCLFLDQLKGWHSNTARRECIWFHGIERDFLVYPELSKVWFAVWFARKSSTSEMLLIQIPTPEPLPTDLEMTNDLTRDGENHGEASRSWRERRWCGQQSSKPRNNKSTTGVWTHERVPINLLQ